MRPRAPQASTCRTSTSAGRAAASRRNSAVSCWGTPTPCWRSASSTTAAPDEALEYWEGIWGRAAQIDPVALVAEKLGYDHPLSYEEWLEVNHFQDLPETGLLDLWNEETALLENAAALSLEAIALQRINAINAILKQYE